MENSDSLQDYGGMPMSCVIAQGGSNNEDWSIPWTTRVILSLARDTAVICRMQTQLVQATAGSRCMYFQGTAMSGRLLRWNQKLLRMNLRTTRR